MGKLYKFASMVAIAILAAFSFSSCDDDETDQPTKPSLEIGTINVTADYEATVILTPSENATSFSWGYAAATATAPETYTKVDGNKATTITTPALEPGSYKIFAYAENKVGKSEIMTKNFDAELMAPTVKMGEMTASRAGISVPVSVQGTDNVYYAYVLKEKGASADPKMPADEKFKNLRTELLPDGNLLIESQWLTDNGTWFVFAYAENEKGRSEVVKASVEYDETKFPKLVSFEVVNITPYSLDVKVDMLEGCAKYVVGGYINGAYTKNSFISSAKSSLDPDPNYPYQPLNWFEKSGLIPERLLRKNELATNPESEGVRIVYQSTDNDGSKVVNAYQIAVYAVDKDGNGAVYVSDEFNVADPATATFGTIPTVTITAEATPQKVIPTFTVNGDCAKLITGGVVPSWDEEVDWSDEAAVHKMFATILGDGMYAYEGKPVTSNSTPILDPNTEYVAYAIPITADGKLGKLCYEKFKTSMPELDGKGSVDVTSLEVTSNSLTYKVELTNATAVRLICEPTYTFNLSYKEEGKLELAMTDPNSKAYRQYSAEELKTMNGIVKYENLQPEFTYVMRAVTIDADGKISKVQAFADQKTLEESTGEGGLDFSKGKGEVKLTTVRADTYYSPKSTWQPEMWEVDYTYSVEKGENTAEVYKVILDDVMDSYESIVATIKDRFEVVDDLPNPFTAFGVEQTQESMMDYDSEWGGSAVAFITKDNDGNYKVASAYYVAKADHNVKTERDSQ